MGRPPKIVSQEKIEQFQLELELAGQDPEILLKDKKGRSRSCLLCQRRKRRCDHKVPSCTACLKAGVKCVQPVKYVSTPSDSLLQASAGNLCGQGATTLDGTGGTDVKAPRPDEYTKFLEKKLRYLEKMLDMPPTGQPFKRKLANYKRIAHLMEGPALGETEESQSPPLSAGGAGAPTPQFPIRPPLSSSACSSPILPPPQTVKFFPLQPETHSSGKVRISNRVASSLAALTSDSLESIDFSHCIFAKYNLRDFLSYDPAFEFEEQLSRAFLDTYFTRLQFKYPLLDKKEIYSFHDDYISNNVHSYSTKEFHFACGRLWLIFSISACLHMSAGKYQGLPPNRYFSTAIRHITKCGENLTYIQQVEILTLLVLYMIRTDRDSSGLYEIIKDVMSICKNKLYLNRWNAQDLFASKKLRLFWCVYLLERMICVAVGKPYTIPESEIDLPLFDLASFNSGLMNDDKRHERGLNFINQSLKLRRIESQFVERLQIIPQTCNTTLENYKETKELAKHLQQVKTFFHDLEIWRSNCSTSHIPNFENETLKLYYFRSVRLLIQPYLELLEPENRLFRECQAAAGQICQLYKIFHQKTVYGHSTPAVHTVFVAGVTLIYCMWLTRNWDDERRRKLGDISKHTRPLVSASLFSTMDDLRACSACLYVMAERSKFAITFRDTFDQLMNATIGNLIERCGPDSSELIYIKDNLSESDYSIDGRSEFSDKSGPDAGSQSSEAGMPPAIKRTFGTSNDDHVGFVDTPQVDLEERMVLKKKQGDLRKATVPQKLSYLLAPDIDEGEVTEKLSSIAPKNRSNGNARHQSEKDKFFVKKPAHITESDWKAFQQKSFLQQHHAQQTLQAYLASLNGKDRNGGAIPESKQVQERPVGVERPIQSSDINVTSLKGVNAPAVNDPSWTQSVGTAYLGTSKGPVPIATSQAMRTSLSSPPAASVQRRSVNGFTSSDANFNGVLFNNGTHNMINNISTWTNDSVVDLMSNYQADQSSSSNLNMNSNSSNRFDATSSYPYSAKYTMSTSTMPQLAKPLIPGQHQIPPAHREQTQLHSQPDYQQQQQQITHPQQQQQQQRWQPQSHLGRFNSQPVRGQFQSDLLLGTPVEEFWTVNDDYGFLA
ncbi:LAME_0G10286g1_1 [Lachancea meyersii CBS 8951]|uniref:LAME_0G10286g1_1 n=1 Tax=Lachancea meyersii CBS 8951 TaxID=1266667 RepID=A0A1G4K904_9SACH|nr:LAME_0G10286g1_1 [Lachancea meyersii CBS 8951]